MDQKSIGFFCSSNAIDRHHNVLVSGCQSVFTDIVIRADTDNKALARRQSGMTEHIIRLIAVILKGMQERLIVNGLKSGLQ